MGAARQGSAPSQLLRERPARCHVRRFARFLRRLLRHHGGPSLRIARRGRQLESHRARSARSAFGGSANAEMIRVELPAHLRNLAKVTSEIQLEVEGPATQRSVLDALEARFPALRGTIRD